MSNQAEYEFLLEQGISAGSLNDMWQKFFDSEGVAGLNINDRMKRWLSSHGFVGNLPDMYHQWIKNITVPQNSTPCMTSTTEPYGEITASASLENGSITLWKGMNCTTVDSVDTWCVPVDTPMPVWIQWRFDSSPPSVPKRVRIKPRVDMAASWYADHNPREIKIYVIHPDDSLTEVAHFDELNWMDSEARDFYIQTDEDGIGVRLEITRTNTSDDNGGLGHTCIGYWQVFGSIPPLDYVQHNGEGVEFNGNPVFYVGDL